MGNWEGKTYQEYHIVTGKYPASTKDAHSMIHHSMLEEREWRLDMGELLLEERQLGSLEEPDLDLLDGLCAD